MRKIPFFTRGWFAHEAQFAFVVIQIRHTREISGMRWTRGPIHIWIDDQWLLWSHLRTRRLIEAGLLFLLLFALQVWLHALVFFASN